ncbi:MAG: DUF2124 domain-containing protein [Methanosarcinales archaeon]|nr:DUF2124 domain-containing protein [Methanosarcinales archaeon]
MKTIEVSEALGGVLNGFRKISRDSKKITFIGTPGFCTPFAELIAFVIRDSGIEMAFVPNISVDKARTIISTSQGMQLGESTDPSCDTVVLLGGLAMPKMKMDVNKVKKVIEDITTTDKPLIIGVCFMSIFKESGWIDTIDFDYVIDSYIKNTTLEK